MSSDRLLAELLNRCKLLDHSLSRVESAAALGGRPAQRDALRALYHTVQLFTTDVARLRSRAAAEGNVEVGSGYNDEWLVAAPPHDPAPSSDAAAPEPEGNGKVLVVDPDERTRTLATAMLRELGYRVHESRTGEEALAHLAAHPDQVHLLLTAQQLPGMTGQQLAEAVTTWHPLARTLYTQADAPLRPSELARKVCETLGTASGEAFSAA